METDMTAVPDGEASEHWRPPTDLSPVASWFVRFAASLEVLLGYVAKGVTVLVNAILAIIILLNTANILWRITTTYDLIFVFPLTNFLMVWLIFLGFFTVYFNHKDASLIS